MMAQSPDLGRRALLRGRSPRRISAAILPPWALPRAEFINTCERCSDCLEACPQHILVRGDGGFPEVNFRNGECTFCGQCVSACKAGAFRAGEYTPHNAWELLVNIKPTCLSLNGIVCRTCGDHCDTRAIRFRLQTRAVAVPDIEQTACTGCGACKNACPVNAVEIIASSGQQEEQAA